MEHWADEPVFCVQWFEEKAYLVVTLLLMVSVQGEGLIECLLNEGSLHCEYGFKIQSNSTGLCCMGVSEYEYSLGSLHSENSCGRFLEKGTFD